MVRDVARLRRRECNPHHRMYERLKHSYGTRLAFLIFAALVAVAILGIRKVCEIPSHFAEIFR